MSKKKPEGYCHICGQFGPLSFEHVPPRAAFNNRRVIIVNFETAMKLGPEEITKGAIQQNGRGAYTLCYRCNNNTGHWYGTQFVEWCYQGMRILIRAKGEPSSIYLGYTYPLPIIKQIVTMFFSVIGPEFRIAHPELVEFVLNKEKKYLSPKYRFFVYYNIEGKSRAVGGAALLNLNKGGKASIISEISFPPFGYLMSLDSEPPDNRLYEITHFSTYEYKEQKTLELKLPVLPTHLAIPGDYRTKEEIIQQAKQNANEN